MKPWILVIDDDSGTREALAEILGRAGYQVSTWADDTLLEVPTLSRNFQVAIFAKTNRFAADLFDREHLFIHQVISGE